MLSMIISCGCTSPTIPQSIAATNRSLCWGSFLCFGFWQLVVLSLFHILKWGCWRDAHGLVVLQLWHFAHQWPFFHNLCMPSHGQGSCFYWGVLTGVVGAWWVGCHPAWDHVSGGQGVQHVPHVLHTLQLLLTPQHSMFCRSLASVISFCHSWPSEVICAARCWHLRSPESACIELQILLQHHCHCWFVP